MKQNCNDLLAKIYKSLSENNFNAAYKINELLYNNEKNERTKTRLSYIYKLIKEEEANYLNSNNKENLLRQKYIRIGNKLSKLGKKELSFYAYNVGYRLTKHYDFLYFIALHYKNEKNYITSKEYLLKYINQGGIKYLEECYYNLKDINNILMSHQEEMFDLTNKAHYRQKSNKYYSKIRDYEKLIKEVQNLKKGIFSIEKQKIKNNLDEINLNNNESKELIKKGKLNDVENMYYESDYNTKITILAQLYLNNFSSFADKLYKKEKDDLMKNCPTLTKKLNFNKQLYITKAKFNK